MKWKVFSTEYWVALSLLLDVSALLSRAHKSLRGSQLVWLAQGWWDSRGRCTTAAEAEAAKAGDDDFNISSHGYFLMSTNSARCMDITLKDLSLAAFHSVILHFSYLSPQYPLEWFGWVQLCISGIPTFACPWHFSGLFSLSHGVKEKCSRFTQGFFWLPLSLLSCT